MPQTTLGVYLSMNLIPPLRRRLLLTLATLLFLGLLACGDAHAFSFDTVEAQAKALAAKAYQEPDTRSVPPQLAKLNFHEYQQISYKPSAALWQGSTLGFQADFLIEGNAFRTPVKINAVDSTGVRPITFDPGNFDYGNTKLDPAQLKHANFSGLQIHFPLNSPKQGGMVLQFQGANYFRALGKGQVEGLSARGLAIDTGLISGEEFPQFKEFWIERPATGDKAMVIDALLDSKRATGAYRFVLRPGATTVVDVQARIYLRDYITKLGLAPLGSMYLYGENQPNHSRDDYRPEVHDSDGLQIESGTGEWIWRPLVNPKRLLITSFMLTNPQGFGLMQRDRDFDDYQDLKARFDLRPSAWVEPKGNWGTGRIELVEIPSPDETNGNIVAFWVPDNGPKLQQPFDFSYRINWQMQHQTNPPSSWVTQTRRGRNTGDTSQKGIGFVIDFNGPALKKLTDDAKVDSVVSVDGNGEILDRSVVHNDAKGGWRLILQLRRMDDSKPVELRAYLRTDHNTISETWSYILPPS